MTWTQSKDILISKCQQYKTPRAMWNMLSEFYTKMIPKMFCMQHCKLSYCKKKQGYTIKGLKSLYLFSSQKFTVHICIPRSWEELQIQKSIMLIAHLIHLSTISSLHSDKIQLTFRSESLVVSFFTKTLLAEEGRKSSFPFLLAFPLCVQWSKFMDKWDTKCTKWKG